MRILLLNDFRIGGGAEVVFLKTYEVLIELGHQVDLCYHNEKMIAPSSIFSYLFSIREYNKMYDRLLKERYNIVYLLNYARAYSPSILLAIRKFKKRNPDIKVVYNVHDAHIICPNSALTFFKGTKMCLFPQTPKINDFIFKKLDDRGHLYSLLKKVQWLLAYKVLKLYDVFDLMLCPSLFLSSKIGEIHSNKNIQVLRNPIDLSLFHDCAAKGEDKQCSLRLIYFGRLSASEKGLGVLIDNISKISDSYSLDIYGDGPDENFLKNRINDLNAQNKICLKGKLPWRELINRLSFYDAFILPSYSYENAPLSIVEAAAAGLYVLTMNYGGMKELAQIVGNSYFINPISQMTLQQAFEFVNNTEYVKKDLSIFSEETFKKALADYLKI